MVDLDRWTNRWKAQSMDGRSAARQKGDQAMNSEDRKKHLAHTLQKRLDYAMHDWEYEQAEVIMAEVQSRITEGNKDDEGIQDLYTAEITDEALTDVLGGWGWAYGDPSASLPDQAPTPDAGDAEEV
jgi:hypothetical protein